MPSENKTSLGLNQWSPQDRPVMQDFNSDNEIVDGQLRELLENKANYSSGTWTPVGINCSLNATTAKWSKTGRHVQATFSGNMQKGNSGGFEFSGLPFAASQHGTCTAIFFGGILAPNCVPIPSYILNTTASIALWWTTTGRIEVPVPNTRIESTGEFLVRIVFEYETDA